MKSKRWILAGVLIFVSMGIVSSLSGMFSSDEPVQVSGSIYDFKVKSLDGKEIDFSQYKGKKLLIINTASKCGKTPQYAGLEKLHEQYGQQVTLLGFPANNFLWQEPGTNAEIAAFCERNYGVKFQMFEKVSVKGSDQHPLYRWLQGMTGHKPDWNFAKYLVSEDGQKVTFFKSSVEPLDPQLVSSIAK